jgi:L-ascorbate metabolism protein UlaG (beta-lactamase superfamily)
VILLTGLAALTALLGLAAAGVMALTQMGELPDEAEQNAYSQLPNYAGGVFVNPEPVTLKLKKKFMFFRSLRHVFRSENAPGKPLPSVKLDRRSFSEEPGAFSVRWLGHSSLIFELGAVRFMTDPVFGNASPLGIAVRRYGPSPLPREELPKLDFVIISHDHYDHLEYDTIRFLRGRGTVFVTPLGVGARLRGWGVPAERINELNWGDSVTLSGVKITAQTARHFSGRSTKDRDKTLWASFVLEGGGRKIYFGADGGCGAHFKEIGDKFGPFDLTCLEIDAWNGRWPNNHLFPEEVIKANKDLRGSLLLPIHWGVFDLAMHPWDESINKVTALAKESGTPLLRPVMGEKVTPDPAPPAGQR